MKRLLPLLAAALIALSACKKDLQAPEQATQSGQQASDNGFFKKDRPTPDMVREGSAPMPGNGGQQAFRTENEYADELPTVLGAQLPNPYTTANMAAAYNLMYGTNYTELPATNLYVRFEPNADAQVALLEDSMDLDVYDHPLDHELLQDGDYYVHPGKTIEDLPWLYTVVKPGFDFASLGIPHTVLAQLYLPGDNNLFLEELSESMAAGAGYVRSTVNGQVLLTRTDLPGAPSARVPDCPEPIGVNPLDSDGNLADPCYGGGNGGSTGSDGTPPPAPGTVCGLPPLQCASDRQPRGRLRVWDTQKNACVPLVNTQVTFKRWFKGVQRKVYTDAQGGFTAQQQFSGKVKVIVYFRNNTLSVRPLRNKLGIRLSLLPLRHNLGGFRGCDMNTIDQVYYRGEDRETKAFARWLGAHAVNARNDQWTGAVADEIKPFTGHRLVLYLVRGGAQYNRRPEAELVLQSYLFKKRGIGEWTLETAKLAGYLLDENPVAAAVQYYNMILGGQRPDILYRYNTLWENLSSSEANQQFYSVYAQAGLLKAVESGESDVKWKRYFKAKAKDVDAMIGALGGATGTLSKMVASSWRDDGTGLYTLYDGTKWSASSLGGMVVTLGLEVYYSLTQPDREFYHQVRGFGEYYGHWLADKRYLALADPILNQKRERVNGDATGSSHKKYLENWDPTEPLDELIYSKEGLFHDLEDPTTATPERFFGTQIDDLVSGIKAKDYEKAIMGGAVYANPVLWDQCRDNLKLTFPLQADNIVDLYKAYRVW